MRQGNTTDFVAFGRRGLWTSAGNQILPVEYCTRAENLRLSTVGSLSVRQGWADQTTTELSSKNIESLHEFVKADETVEMIVAWDGGIANDIDDPAGNDISGSVTDTSGTWFFQNFNDKCLGFQSGQKMIVYTGTGNFATVVEAAGTAPTGGVGCAAYGRVWQVGSDGSTLYYTTLLNETNWGGTGSGSIDMNNIWTDGQDTIMAVRGFNGSLVVWGKRHVVFFSDAQGSSIGLNPDNIYVQDIIAGTGCISQHTVQLIGEKDILFCSYRGVQSLGRLIQEKSNPIDTVSSKVEEELVDDIKNTMIANQDSIRACYSVVEGIYILSFPTRSISYVMEMRHLYQDEVSGGLRAPVFTWTLAPYSWAYRVNGDLLLGSTNKVGKYSTYTDDTTSIKWTWNSPWIDLGEQLANRLKILKRVGLIVESTWGGNIVCQWATDFDPFDDNVYLTSLDTTSGAEYGVGEFGIAEYGTTIPMQQIKRPARETGQYYKFALEATVNVAMTLQQFEIFYKIGRLA